MKHAPGYAEYEMFNAEQNIVNAVNNKTKRYLGFNWKQVSGGFQG